MARACTASPIWMCTWACGERTSSMGKASTSTVTEIGSRASSRKERKLTEDLTNTKADLFTMERGRKTKN